MPNYYDLEYVGYDESAGCYHVHEQLYPETRGFIVHEFPTEVEALSWMQSQPRSR